MKRCTDTNKHHAGFITTRHIYINTPDGPCYRRIATQLEQTAKWDLMVLHMQPISSNRINVGATTYLYIDFLGKKFHGLATVSELRAKNTVSWNLTGGIEMRIYWRIIPEKNGTSVSITLAWKDNSRLADLSVYRALQRKRVDLLLDKMLKILKETVEKEEALDAVKEGVAV